MTNSPFMLSIEPVDAPAYQHGYHLGTIEPLARDMAESLFKCLRAYPETRLKAGTRVCTVALIRDGRVFDVFDGGWHSDLDDFAEEPKPAIVTEFIYPPIPIRDFDWSACRDGYEPGDAQGYGRTQEEAIADLLAIEEERA